MLDGIACRLYINGEGGGRVLCAPATAEADDSIDQPLLWYAVEEADEVVVDGGECRLVCLGNECEGAATGWESRVGLDVEVGGGEA